MALETIIRLTYIGTDGRKTSRLLPYWQAAGSGLLALPTTTYTTKVTTR
jgi:hypothetical protein